MKQSDIVKSYKALSKLSQKDLPIRLAFDLFRVKSALQQQWDFQIEEETKAAAGATRLEDGRLEFPTAEAAAAFRDKLKELGEIDVNLDIPQARIPLSSGLRVSVEDIEALTGIITFE